MARRVDKSKAAAAPEGAAAASDLETLFPDLEVRIRGVMVTVREYRFTEGLRLRSSAKPFFEALYTMFDQSAAVPSFEDVADVLGEHIDLVEPMVAQACGRDVDWVQSLNDRDGDSLMVTWWLANAGFFTRRVIRRAAQARMAGAPPAGHGSTTSSSPPATSGTLATSEG